METYIAYYITYLNIAELEKGTFQEMWVDLSHFAKIK